MGDLDKTCTGWNRTGHGTLDSELIPSHGSTDDIDDRIDRSNFMKVNLVDRHPMNRRFGFGKPLEDPTRDFPSTTAEPRSGDATEDLIQIPMLGIFRSRNVEFDRAKASFANSCHGKLGSQIHRIDSRLNAR